MFRASMCFGWFIPWVDIGKKIKRGYKMAGLQMVVTAYLWLLCGVAVGVFIGRIRRG